jgi:hypothetical protein
MADILKEWPTILPVALEYGVDGFFVAAIRVAENGPPGKEFGVEDPDANTYEAQLRECCATVRNRLVAYTANPLGSQTSRAVQRLAYSATFAEYFRNSWAPLGAPNDPEGLNQNWLRNVLDTYSRYVKNGEID